MEGKGANNEMFEKQRIGIIYFDSKVFDEVRRNESMFIFFFSAYFLE